MALCNNVELGTTWLVTQKRGVCVLEARTSILRLEADIGASRSKQLLRAHCVNSVFSLHALAARKILRQRKIRCCRAAGKPAIRAERSIDQWPNLQTADLPDLRNCFSNGRCFLDRSGSET